MAAGFLADGLTGWDLAGPEEAFPDPLLHARAFATAREAGLRITVHAGEWGGAAQVRRSLALDPARIAHGPGAIDDPALCRELAARGVPLDLCPTSNWQAGIVPSIAAHPLARLHRLGVPVTLSTDDTTVSDLSLTDEYERALDQIGLTFDELWAIDRAALDVAFADARPGNASAPASTPGRRTPPDQRARRSRTSASSEASLAIAVGRRSAEAASTSARDVTPVSIRTLRAPTAIAAPMSVPRLSPIITASFGSRPTVRAASSSRYGSGLPIENGVTPLAASIAATMDPAPGRTARSVG